MDEGGGDDDAGAKVLGHEEDPRRHVHARVAAGPDGEDGACHAMHVSSSRTHAGVRRGGRAGIRRLGAMQHDTKREESMDGWGTHRTASPRG